MINIEKARTMIRRGQIEGGMVPKVRLIHALQHGVSRTHIIDGRRYHSLPFWRS